MNSASAIIGVDCIEGPCHGLQYIDLDSGRILFGNTGHRQRHIYRVSDTAATIDLGYPSAYYDHTEPPLPESSAD